MIACSGLSSCACASSVHHQSTLVNILFKLTNMVPLPDLFSTTRALECLRRASFTDRVPTGVQQSSAKTSTKLHERHLFPGSVNRILICFARYVLITFCKKRAEPHSLEAQGLAAVQVASHSWPLVTCAHVQHCNRFPGPCGEVRSQGRS
jgi:hypothetical protein